MAPAGFDHVPLQDKTLGLDCECPVEPRTEHRCGRRLKLFALIALPLVVCASALAWRCKSPFFADGRGTAAHGRPFEASASREISLVAEDEQQGADEKLWESVHVNMSTPLSLFCFSVVMMGGAEEQLINYQWAKRQNIFSCHGWEVVADQGKQIGGEGADGFFPTVLPGGIHDKKGVVGVNCAETPGYLNSWSFMEVWRLLITQKRVWRHDFICKVDADAVFYPDRLPSHAIVQQNRGKPVVLANCFDNKLWGSLEVLSREALAMYAADIDMGPRKPDVPACPETCKKLPWWCWGEDQYIQQCLQALGVPSIFDQMLVAHGCNGGSCSDPRVAFHKFDTDWKQEQCRQIAAR
mmetsp:Transcript_99845/g.265352  ORF Transcript_99845/g.265352 Transcript_99845/m.265352 type:complete len:353 (-) Transcript_99845:90-1148(-)